jgi:transposase InsO family protein
VAIGLIHWSLADGTDVEILNWLDDHSRYLLSCTAHQPVTGDAVVAAFLDAIDDHGPPASTLTDNGSVYTSRFTGGRNAFEYLLPLLGIRQKNGSPGHPQTQGKTERFHQTQQRWLAARPAAHTSPSSSTSSIGSASTTTNNAPTAPSTAEPQATPTAPPPKPAQRATATTPATTACATTGSTPKAR